MSDLDPVQKRIVSKMQGPILVCAGPGSGKTRILIQRILYLLEQGVAPEAILAVTFTNRAAREMEERLAGSLGSKQFSTFPLVATLHSLCLEILRERYERPIIILDALEQLEIMRKVKSDMKEKVKLTVREIASELTRYKSQDNAMMDKMLEVFISSYQKYLKRNSFLDYDDLLIEVLTLLRNDEGIRKEYQERFSYVFVDEYQDINQIQDQIIKILAEPQKNLFVIGDTDQSIYGFRGSDMDLFLKFQGEFDGVCVINLEQNYRSSPSIVKSSLSLVEHNKKRIPIKLSSNIVEDHPVEVIRCGNEKDEAKFIVSEIEKIVGGTTLLHIDSGILDQKEDSQEYQFSDFAVLYRKNAFVRYLEGEFLHRGIPYQIIGKDSFWQFKEVREVISLLKDLARTKTFISDKFNLSKLIEDHIQKSYKGDSQVSENMKKFMELVGEFEYASIWELLSQIALLSRETYIDRRANCVKLMTLHQAKGLEFENVFIAGVEEGFVPLLRVGCPSDDLEEERRLLYVGMTRAKKRLYLTYARNRLIWGKREKRLMSRFIHEIDEGTTRFKEFIRQRKKKDQMKLF